LLAKLDSVYITPSDNTVETYSKMEEYARVLRSSSGDILLGKFLNALPTEYDF